MPRPKAAETGKPICFYLSAQHIKLLAKLRPAPADAIRILIKRYLSEQPPETTNNHIRPTLCPKCTRVGPVKDCGNCRDLRAKQHEIQQESRNGG